MRRSPTGVGDLNQGDTNNNIPVAELNISTETSGSKQMHPIFEQLSVGYIVYLRRSVS